MLYRTSSDKFNQLQTNLTNFRQVETSRDKSRQVETSRDKFGQGQRFRKSRPLWTRLDHNFFPVKFRFSKKVTKFELIKSTFLTFLENLNFRIPSTLFESENERQKIEPVPILLPRASRKFPDVKTRKVIVFHNWTSGIIPFIRFGMQMDRTKKFFLDVLSCIFIVIQLCYNDLWPLDHQKWSKIENSDNLAFEKSQKILSKMPQ